SGKLMRREFRLDHAGKTHTIFIEAALTGREVIALDGNALVDKVSFKLKTEVAIPIPGRDVIAKIRLGKGLMPALSEWVDGRRSQGPNVARRTDGDHNSSDVARSASGTSVHTTSRVPRWGYAFVAACVLIPVVTLGGAIPAAIGGAGTMSCLAVLRAD